MKIIDFKYKEPEPLLQIIKNIFPTKEDGLEPLLNILRETDGSETNRV